MLNNGSRGFSLVELVAVIVVLAVISVSVLQRSLSTSTIELQGSRDLLISAFFSAQQLAMSQNKAVSITTSSSTIDVLIDNNDDGTPETSAQALFESYPQTIDATLNTSVFLFDKLGQTTQGSIIVSQGGQSVTVNVSETGYAY